jgi:hypothetical protein
MPAKISKTGYFMFYPPFKRRYEGGKDLADAEKHFLAGVSVIKPDALNIFFWYMVMYAIVTLCSVLFLESFYTYSLYETLASIPFLTQVYVIILINALLPFIVFFNYKSFFEKITWYACVIHCIINIITGLFLSYHFIHLLTMDSYGAKSSLYLILALLIILSILAINLIAIFYLNSGLIKFLFNDKRFKLFLENSRIKFFLIAETLLTEEVNPSKKPEIPEKIKDLAISENDMIIITDINKVIDLYLMLSPEIDDTSNTTEEKQLSEFKKQIDHYTRLISKKIVQSLEMMRDTDIICDDEFEMLKKHYTDIENIMLEFTLRATPITADIRKPFARKAFSPPVIKEIDFYRNIYYLIHKWLKDSGERVDDFLFT